LRTVANNVTTKVCSSDARKFEETFKIDRTSMSRFVSSLTSRIAAGQTPFAHLKAAGRPFSKQYFAFLLDKYHDSRIGVSIVNKSAARACRPYPPTFFFCYAFCAAGRTILQVIQFIIVFPVVGLKKILAFHIILPIKDFCAFVINFFFGSDSSGLWFTKK
jgi:hypothetical protein